MSDVVEAWLPLVLGAIAIIWVPAESFGNNRSGTAWAPVLRMGSFLALYFLLVVPVTLMAVRKSFASMRRVLPPSPWRRVAVTFAVPAALAYVFSFPSGTAGFLIGSVLGLLLMAAVFWLMFHLDPQETAGAYAAAGGAFFGSAAVGVLVLVGTGVLLNHALVAARATDGIRENPLGPNFAWSVPAPQLAHKTTSPDAPVAPLAIAKPLPGETQSPAVPIPDPATTPKIIAPDGQPVVEATPAVLKVPDGSAMPNPATSNAAVPKADDGSDLNSELFRTSNGPMDTDPFVSSIQEAKLPWVRWVYRPSDQGIYEQSIAPLTASPFVAMLRLPGIGGRTVECCRLAPQYRGMGALALSEDGTDLMTTSGRFALSDDGSALLRLDNGTPPKVDVLPFRGVGSSVPLTLPDAFSRGGEGLASPELLGGLPGRQFLVRWSRGEQAALQVYAFEPKDGKPRLTFKLGQTDAPAVYAVSPDGSRFITEEREAEQSFLAVYSLTGSGGSPAMIPVSKPGDTAQRQCSGIAVSPDGTKVAVLLEQGTEGVVRCWKLAGEARTAEGRCKIPSADEMLGQVRGRTFDWVTNGKWLVHGRKMLDAGTGAEVGVLSTEVVIAQQMADDHTAYLNYLGQDGHPHMAVVKFDPAVLNGGPAGPVSATSAGR